jgi:hypothetical protein
LVIISGWVEASPKQVEIEMQARYRLRQVDFGAAPPGIPVRQAEFVCQDAWMGAVDLLRL